MLSFFVYSTVVLKKVWFYRNVFLFAEIFTVFIKLWKNKFSLCDIKHPERKNFISARELETLQRYVCVFLSFIKIFGAPNTCYVKSLTLAALLQKKGVPVTLHFSAGSRDGEISGHAHLETQGKNIFGPVDDFQPFFVFPENENYEKTGNTV